MDLFVHIPVKSIGLQEFVYRGMSFKIKFVKQGRDISLFTGVSFKEYIALRIFISRLYIKYEFQSLINVFKEGLFMQKYEM